MGKYSKRIWSQYNDWIKKYDRNDLMNTSIMVENLDEISRIRALQKEIELLKEATLKERYSIHDFVVCFLGTFYSLGFENNNFTNT